MCLKMADFGPIWGIYRLFGTSFAKSIEFSSDSGPSQL